MKKSIAIISLLVSVSSAWAALITDNFNRDNTAQTANTVNVGGSGWVQAGDGTATGSDWFISGNTLNARNRTNPANLYNDSLKTVSGSGTNFTLSADVSAKIAGAYAGITFNYQNASNYYVVRLRGDFNTYQMLKVVDGVAGIIVSKTDSSQKFTLNSLYTITVTSDVAGDFDFTITAAGNSTVLNPTTSGTDTISIFTEGYAGLYVGTGLLDHTAKFDNFSLNVIPEPATIGLFGVAVGVVLLIRRKRF